jgi:stage II sporulation protein AA (anti-sigma F factor antagonist)
MFDIRIGEDGTLHFSGRLDASQSKAALDVLSEVDRPASADFSNLAYISSAGIGVILGTFKRLSDSGHSFRIINATPRITTVFRYAGLTDILGIEERPPE